MVVEELTISSRHLYAMEQSAEDEPSKRSRLGSLAGKLALAGAAGAAFFGVGAMVFVPAHTHVGPHEADAYLTTDSVGSLDTGFLGSLNKPVQLGGFGVRVDIRGVRNQDVGGGELVSPQKTKEYIQLISDPERDQNQVQTDLINHLAKGTAPLGALLGIGVFGSFYVAMGPDTRKQRAEQLKNGSSRWIALGVLATAITGVGWGMHQMNQAQQRTGNLGAAFKETGLRDIYADGSELRYIIRTYGTYLAEGDKFVQKVDTNLKAAQKIIPLLTPTQQTKTVLFEAGMKCNNVVAKNTGSVYKIAKPSMFISAGDLAGTGTPLDSQCIDTLAFRIKGKKLVSPGNHDSDQAIKAMHDNGFEILDGKTVDANGLRVLGAINPRESIPLAGTRPRVGDSVSSTAALSDQLATVACNDIEGVDIIVANEPRSVEQVQQRSCGKLVVSAVRGEHQINIKNPEIMLASSSGTENGALNIGRPDATGERTIVEFDSKTHRPLRYQIIRIKPDGNVDIAEPVFFAH